MSDGATAGIALYPGPICGIRVVNHIDVDEQGGAGGMLPSEYPHHHSVADDQDAAYYTRG